jgi:hypothetical protein
VWGWTSLRTSHDMLHSLILSWLSLLCFTFMPCSLCESHSKKCYIMIIKNMLLCFLSVTRTFQ